MPRPFRCRRVRCSPDANYFKPRGIPVDSLEEVDLTMDELEAVRLADLEGKYQEDAAKNRTAARVWGHPGGRSDAGGRTDGGGCP